MGKSNKKAKSERINALRKQYDAFIEQDKKRKERNEYILGRLDKMRSCTALVPARYKPNVLDVSRLQNIRHRESITVLDYKSSKANESQLIPSHTNEDTYSIQEISKKYILIPKTKSIYKDAIEPGYENQVRQQEAHTINELDSSKDIDENNDNLNWKNKYEILNILKKKDSPATTFHNDIEFTPTRLKNTEAFSKDSVYNDYLPTEVEKANILNELPEKDKPNDKFIYEKGNNDDTNQVFTISSNLNLVNEIQNVSINKTDTKTDLSVDFATEKQQDSDITLPAIRADIPDEQFNNAYDDDREVQLNECLVENSSIIAEQNDTVEPNETVSKVEYVQNSIVLGNEDAYLSEERDANNIPQESTEIYQGQGYIDQNNIQTEADHNNDFQSEHLENEHTNIVESDVTLQEYPGSIEQVQDLSANHNVFETDGDAFTQHVENVVDTEQINDNQVEPTNQQPDDLSEIPVANLNPETDNVYYSNEEVVNDPYQQNQQAEYQNQEYAYYEEPHEPEAYPQQVNDHEGEAGQYDPNYEQTYVDPNQQYSNPEQAIEQQEYEQPHQYQGYEDYGQAEPAFDQQYEQTNDPQAQIDQVPQYEDGYNIAEQGVEQQYVSEVGPHEQNPEDVDNQYQGDMVEQQNTGDIHESQELGLDSHNVVQSTDNDNS